VDARRQKAHDLADRARITFKDGCYTVPSQSGNGSYTVILDDRDAVCDCPDFELRDKPCKHIMGVRLFVSRETRGVEQDTENLNPSPKVKRPTYPQDWPNYNAAQVNEQGHFQTLLADLCGTVKEPERTGRGRRPIRLADQVYAATMKVYSLFSARRFMGHIDDAVERGHVGQRMHFNSVLNALENPALTPILHKLIQLSSLPLRTVEQTFAPDSTGFCTSRFIRWFDVKYGVTREQAEWVKCHLMTGVKTNIVTAVEILDKYAGDSPQMPALVETTAKTFKINEVDADKAYTAVENFDVVAKHGGTLYAPFKSNMTGAAGGIFEKMYYKFMLSREEFLQHYHQRSNVESTISAIKRKFGDSVRSKCDTAMKNEVLCKILGYNLTVCISAWYELDLEPLFNPGCTNNDGPAQILTLPGA
jgi:transposase